MDSYPQRSIVVRRHLIQSVFLPIPVACFIGALLTDVTYWRTAEMMWANFSAWLLTAGLAMGVVTAIAAAVDWFSGRASAFRRPLWPFLLGSTLVFILSVFNAFVHSRDAWTSVVPTGLTLSIAVVAIIVITGFVEWLAPSEATVGVVQ